ncbi:hypothetical protein AGMMS49938_14180 [Fibrobacterales bacterium]|nr:hypothetical protein AGMMS49938_14180 [Fibrobacterales bacterium]
MPTLLIENGFRFYFQSNDHSPPHIHIIGKSGAVKFSLGNAVELIENKGMTVSDLKDVKKIVLKNNLYFLERWNAFFGD